ncbi:MAG: hypothetical protein R2807_07395 [Chitinophagales bacterium]
MAKSKILKKIETMHPKNDAWEIIRLTAYYEFPWDVIRGTEYALYKTYAVPSISKILYSTKEFVNNPQKRYDDTDLFISEILEHGLHEGRGKQALERMNWIHSNYKISNDDYLYVLSTFLFDVYYWINNFGHRKLTSIEELAGFYVWKEIGEQMHIQHIPDSIHAFLLFHDEYERKHFRYAESNVKVAAATEKIFLNMHFPKQLHDTIRPFLYAAMEPHLLKALHYEEPGLIKRKIVQSALKARSSAEHILPRNKPFIRTRDNKYKTYPNGYTLDDLGPDKLMKSSRCPFHKS